MEGTEAKLISTAQAAPRFISALRDSCLCLPPEPPRLEDAGKMLNETVVENSPVQLECRAAGSPPPGMSLMNFAT